MVLNCKHQSAGRKHPTGKKYQLVNMRINLLIAKLDTIVIADFKHLGQIAKAMVILIEQ